ncbi:MAG TPA: hypothetical protein VN736_29345 [Candidatus Limnocylindrales bacterium]|nr:hypothetical protein [Candidatus Limnocylindrales bacterium]
MTPEEFHACNQARAWPEMSAEQTALHVAGVRRMYAELRRNPRAGAWVSTVELQAIFGEMDRLSAPAPGGRTGDRACRGRRLAIARRSGVAGPSRQSPRRPEIAAMSRRERRLRALAEISFEWEPIVHAMKAQGLSIGGKVPGVIRIAECGHA